MNADGNFTLVKQFIKPTITQYIVTNTSTCGSAKGYVTADMKQCVWDCPDGFKTGNTGQYSICVCNDEKYYDAVTDTCITKEECNKYTYIGYTFL